MSVKENKIEGDAIISGDVTTGGGVTANGSSVFKKNLKVEGWLEASNLRGPCKGLFDTETYLKKLYPNPKEGYWAMVGDTVPALVYMAKNEGGNIVWVNTGNHTANLGINVNDSELQASIDELESRLDTERTTRIEKTNSLATKDSELQASINDLRKADTNLRTELLEVISNSGQATEGAVSVLADNLNIARQDIADLTREISILKSVDTEITKDLASLQDQINDISELGSRLDADVNTNKSDISRVDNEIIRIDEEIVNINNSIASLNNEDKGLNFRITQLENKDFVKIKVPNLTLTKMGVASADEAATFQLFAGATSKGKPILLVDTFGRIVVPTINVYDSDGLSISYSCIDERFKVTNYVKDICVDGLYDEYEYPSAISFKSFDDIVNIRAVDIIQSFYSGAQDATVVYNSRTNTFVVKVWSDTVQGFYAQGTLLGNFGKQSSYGTIPTANTIYSTANNTYLSDGTKLIAISTSNSGDSSNNSQSCQNESVFSRIGYSAEEVNICHDDELDYSEEVKVKYEDNEITNFSNDSSLIYPPMVDVSEVKDLSRFYFKCTNILTIPSLNTIFATKMVEMLAYCSSLRSIPYIDTANVEDMDSMFYNCTSLVSVPDLATGRAKNMAWMFSLCTSLTTVSALDYHSATNVSNMFNGCKALTKLSYLNTKSATNMKKMFADCVKLERIEGLDFDSVTDMTGIFTGCDNLKSLLIYNLGKSALTFYNLSDLSNWGTGSNANRNTLIDSLINFSHDRARDNMERATIRLSNSTFGLLSAVNLSAMSEKGYDVVAY